MTPEEVKRAVVERVIARYEDDLPAIPGAAEAVERLARAFPLGLATSSNREVVDAVLAALGVADRFAATVSSEEVARGKPSPDVYLEAAAKLGVDPRASAAIEDSTNGIRSAAAAGRTALAIPNPHFPPAPDAIERAAVVLGDLGDLTPATVRAAAAER